LVSCRSGLEEKELLPGVHIPDGISISADLEESCDGSEVLVFAVPTHGVRAVAGQIGALPGSVTLLVNLAKGLEPKTDRRMSGVFTDALEDFDLDSFAVLSGPSHAEEVSRGVPTAVVAASVSDETAASAQDLFSSGQFRVYTTTDLTGVEVGGALKNVVAIASGICEGAGFGDNTRATLMTRGLREITRFGVAIGAKEETFAGLSGMGDLVVTCLSRYSRNRFVGECIGTGESLSAVLKRMSKVAEGVETTRAVCELSRRLGIEMPIAEEVYQVLFNSKSAQRAVDDLMQREPIPERTPVHIAAEGAQ